MSKFDQRLPGAQATPFFRQVIDDLNVQTETMMQGLVSPLLYAAGSWRRWLDGDGTGDVGDVDLIVSLPDGLDLHDVETPGYLKVTPKKAFGWLTIGEQRMHIDAWLCPVESRGPFAFFLTGPMLLNVTMRQISQSRGLMLTQYGLFEPVPAPTKTYPNRVKPGARLDEPTPNPRLGLEACEQAFWVDWTEAVGLGEVPWPSPSERKEVTRWLQERSRVMRSAATSPG